MHFRLSFAPISTLIDFMASGYDPHYLIFQNQKKEMTGLIAFNVDTMV